MSAIQVNGQTPFGAISNQLVRDFYALDAEIARLQNAVAAAASGFVGTAGTEYESSSNFGVVPGTTPGAQGAAWAFAVGSLQTQWTTFKTAAQAYITALDNG